MINVSKRKAKAIATWALRVTVLLTLLGSTAFANGGTGVGTVSASSGSVHVADFGAVPNDGNDDAVAIRNAIHSAIQNNKAEVVFAAGQYDLMIADSQSEFYLMVENASNLTLRGQADANGKPTTRLVRTNPVVNNSVLPKVLHIRSSHNITVRNLLVDNAPYYYTAGVVTAINKSEPSVTVDILTGHPRKSNMGSYVMGAMDSSGNLKFGRLTYNTIGNWQPISGGSGRLMKLTTTNWNSPDVYNRIGKRIDALTVGDTLYWFQSYGDEKTVLIQFGSNIVLDNLDVANAAGFGIEATLVNGFTARNVDVAPIGNRVAVAPRDGFKLNKVYSNVLIEQSSIIGSNDDGQNIHNTLMEVTQKVSNTTLKLKSNSLKGLRNNTPMAFINTSTGDYQERTITSHSYDSASDRLTVSFSSSVPSYVGVGTLASPLGYSPDSYIVRNSTFRNIAGSGIIAKTENAQIYGNTFANNMNPCLLIASKGEFGREGTIPRNIEVRDNLFTNCGQRDGWPLGGDTDGLGDAAAISLAFDKHSAPILNNIRIYNNVIKDNPNHGIYVTDTKNSYLRSNTFSNNLLGNVLIEGANTSNVTNSGNNAYVGRWRLNGSGYEWVYARSGTVNGSPVFSSSDYKEFYTSLNADGVDDYIDLTSQLAHLPKGSSARTIAGWFKPIGASGHNWFTMGENATGKRFGIAATGSKISVDVSGHEWGRNVSLTGWHHIAVTFPAGQTSSDKIKIYLDGVLQTSSTLAGSPVMLNTGSVYAYIGRGGGNAYYKGGIDDVRVYNRELTSAEITDLFHSLNP